MYKVCRTEQSLQRQQMIGRVLIEMMKKQPFHKISVSQLCRQAGIPRKTFYRYFETKEEVIDAYIDHLQQEYLLQLPTNLSRIDQVERLLRFWYERRELLDILIQNDMVGRLIARVVTVALREHMWSCYVPHGAEALHDDTVATFVSSGAFSCVLYCHYQGWQQDLQKIAGPIDELLSRTLYELPNL